MDELRTLLEITMRRKCCGLLVILLASALVEMAQAPARPRTVDEREGCLNCQQLPTTLRLMVWRVNVGRATDDHIEPQPI